MELLGAIMGQHLQATERAVEDLTAKHRICDVAGSRYHSVPAPDVDPVPSGRGDEQGGLRDLDRQVQHFPEERLDVNEETGASQPWSNRVPLLSNGTWMMLTSICTDETVFP